MITMLNRDTIPMSYRRRLEAMAERWPVGAEVRHEAGWTGRVVHDFAGNPHGFGVDAAHGVLGFRPSNVAVCVEATINGHLCTVWYRPDVLAPAGQGKPAPRQVWPPRQRQRTRRAA